MMKFAGLMLCAMLLVAPALASERSARSALMSENAEQNLLAISAVSSRKLLQSGPTDAEVSYCFPYYFIYGYTQNVYSTCLSIVKGGVSGSGDVDDECLKTLLPLYNTFTASIYTSAVTAYNKCLYKTGYTVTSSAANNIASWTVPAITNRVVTSKGKSEAGASNLLSTLSGLNEAGR